MNCQANMGRVIIVLMNKAPFLMLKLRDRNILLQDRIWQVEAETTLSIRSLKETLNLIQVHWYVFLDNESTLV